MKRIYLPILLVVIAFPLWAQPVAKGTALPVHTSAGDFSFESTAPKFQTSVPGLAATGEFVMRDGKDPKVDLPPLALQGMTASKGQGKATASLPGLEFEYNLAASGPWADATVRIRNTGAEQRLLELGWQVQVPRTDMTLWWGFNPIPTNRETIAERFPGQFPVAALYDGQNCLAMGVSPEQTMSYFRRSTKPVDGGIVWEHVNRIVVDPGATESVQFLLANFQTKWGYYEPLHHFYARYPSLFVPAPGVDPRANLNGGSYLAWTNRNDCELARRMRVGWEWAYSPFKRTGDIVGRPQFWDYEPVRPFSADRTVPLEEYHKTRQARFAAGQRDCDVGMMFYIPSQIWAEERLAKEVYPDSLITDKKSKIYFDTPWVTGHDNELRVFPMNTSFGKQSRLDMAEVAKELEIAGFAFDTANGGARYYGPAVPTLPGRAWDDAGVYVDEGVAIADLMHYVHTLPQRYGHKLAVVANPSVSTYLTSFACDSAMIEADPTSTETHAAQSLRAFLGHKSMVYWETYEYEDLLSPTLKPEQMLDALKGLGDHALLASLQMAAMPTPRVAIGNRRLSAWLPLLADMAVAGWQPIPAARADSRLFVTRAGKGLGTYLCSGNMTADTVETRLELENKYLGTGSFFLMRHDGKPTTTQLRGEQSLVPFALSPREPAVWQAAGEIIGGGEATVTAQADKTADQQRWSLEIEAPKGLKTRLRIPVPKDMRVASATINGQKLALITQGPQAECALTVAPGAKARLEVIFKSQVFEVPQSKLLDLPWIENEKPGFTLVTAPWGTPEEEYAIQRLAGYFPYYLQSAMNVKEPAATPVVRQRGVASGAFVVRVQVDPKQARPESITLDQTGRVLTVSGKTGPDVKSAMYRLLTLLDQKFPYAGRLPATPLFKATGVAGLEVK